jgi:hypothetical protein
MSASSSLLPSFCFSVLLSLCCLRRLSRPPRFYTLPALIAAHPPPRLGKSVEAAPPTPTQTRSTALYEHFAIGEVSIGYISRTNQICDHGRQPLQVGLLSAGLVINIAQTLKGAGIKLGRLVRLCLVVLLLLLLLLLFCVSIGLSSPPTALTNHQAVGAVDRHEGEGLHPCSCRCALLPSCRTLGVLLFHTRILDVAQSSH